ncbi:MAG: hypothetical protein IJ728_09645 [Selenomonadaceae bacterium]|nr:hypothetical protein [Selenomonadaceae bacterium]
MNNFEKFMSTHGEKLYDIAKKNTKYNSSGHAIISKTDEWLDEPEWQAKQQEVKSNEEYKIAGNMAGAIPT